MRFIALYRAQDFSDADVVQEMTVVISNPIPDLRPGERRALYGSQAAALADALWTVLPGGTLDALLGEMLARRASLLRVPMPVPTAEGTP